MYTWRPWLEYQELEITIGWTYDKDGNESGPFTVFTINYVEHRIGADMNCQE